MRGLHGVQIVDRRHQTILPAMPRRRMPADHRPLNFLGSGRDLRASTYSSLRHHATESITNFFSRNHPSYTSERPQVTFCTGRHYYNADANVGIWGVLHLVCKSVRMRLDKVLLTILEDTVFILVALHHYVHTTEIQKY
jgi:hypothetical protein